MGRDMNRPDTKDDPIEFTERVAGGLRAVWRRQATYIDGGEVLEIDGLVLTLTNLPDRTLNVAFVERAPAAPSAALRRADDEFRRRRTPFALDLEVGRNPEVEAAAADLGLRRVVARPAMARTLRGWSSPPPPDEATLRRATTGRDLAGFVALQSEVFHIHAEVTRRFIPRAALSFPGLTLYLADLDGRPAATAAAHLDDGAVGIFGVATARWARRRGLATALTARAMADAAPHADLAWLQATFEGRPVYERMGFEVVSEWTVWTT